eukprot:7210856-Prymnesium_polylepis.1
MPASTAGLVGGWPSAPRPLLSSVRRARCARAASCLGQAVPARPSFAPSSRLAVLLLQPVSRRSGGRPAWFPASGA